MQATVQKVIDMSKIRMYGAGIGPDIHANQLVSFTIDSKNVGNMKKIHSQLNHQNGTSVNVALVDNGDETLTASYIAPEPGLYEVVFIVQNFE